MEEAAMNVLISGAEWHISEAIRLHDAGADGIEYAKVALRLLQKITKKIPCRRCQGTGAYLVANGDDPMPRKCEVCFPEVEQPPPNFDEIPF